jgi:pimeloyl-ACP methyl ester carboxylesterase
MERTVVRVNSPIRVTYTFYPASDKSSESVIVVHHGICHTREQFDKLIGQLCRLGFHVAMIEQQSEGAGLFRNCIGLSRYRMGMAAAVRQMLDDERNGEGKKLRLVGYALHSMGALIGEEMQEMHPDLSRPTVLMAPIPIRGALPISIRIFKKYPFRYAKALATLSVHSLVDSEDEVRQWFFDDGAPPDIIEKTARELKHAPFWSYCQLTLRSLMRPRIEANEQPKLMLYSGTDEIFHWSEYENTRYAEFNPTKIAGGHDFFIQSAQDAADSIAAFFKEHTLDEEAQRDREAMLGR